MRAVTRARFALMQRVSGNAPAALKVFIRCDPNVALNALQDSRAAWRGEVARVITRAFERQKRLG